MITKAIIESVISPTSVKVRIPIYNKIQTASGATKTSELSNAIICTLPGITINPMVGDIVIVGFEDENLAKPIIIGYLFSKNIPESVCDLAVSSIKVERNCVLCSDTRIGSVSAKDIYNIKGTNENIQYQINALSERIRILEEAT